MEVHQHQDIHQQDQQNQQQQQQQQQMSQHQQQQQHHHQNRQEHQQQQQQQNNYAVQANFQKKPSISKKTNIRLINAHITDEKLNQEEILHVHTINSVGCKNYGLTADLVEKYPYCDLAGVRYCDSDLKCIARVIDRSPESLCLVRSAPLYLKGPKIETLVTQYGLGKPYEKNGLTQKIVRSCGQESFVHHLRHDTSDNRLIHFNAALKTLSDTLKNNAYPDTNKAILPIGIGRSVVDECWLCRYEIIKKSARDLSHTGIHCYIAVRKPYIYTIEKFVS